MKQLLALLLGACVSLAHGQASLGSPEVVAQVWATAFNECSAEKLAALYDPQATLWGTNSASLTTTPQGIRAYFDRACSATPPIRVALGQVVSRTHGTYATVSGTYEFSREGVLFPSRYSFALISTGNGWRIVQHHSSPLPGRQ